MLFKVQIDGSHAEGSESKTRLDKIVNETVDKLFANGFIADSVHATIDTDAAVSEAETLPTRLTPLDVISPAQARGIREAEAAADAPAQEPIRLTDETPAETTTTGEQAAVLTVEFASDAAAELADESDLTDTDFAGIEPSGATGFTVADVRGVVETKEEAAPA